MGELDIALEKFRNFVTDSKWSWGIYSRRLWLRHSSLFDPIRSEPEFIALLEAYDHNEAEQRQLLQEANFPLPTE